MGKKSKPFKFDKYDIDEIVNSIDAGNKLIVERNNLLHQAKQKQRKIRTLKQKYTFLAELVHQSVKKDTKVFEQLVGKYFRVAGFKNVKVWGKKTTKGDIHIIYNDIAFIIECKNKETGTADRNDISQLPFTHIRIKESPKLKGKELYYISVFDNEYSKPAKDRGNPLNTEMRKYLSEGIPVHGAMVTPLGLLNGFIDLKNNEITFDQYVEKLKTKVEIKF